MEVKSIDTICQEENQSSGLENSCLYCELQTLTSVFKNQKVRAAKCFLTHDRSRITNKSESCDPAAVHSGPSLLLSMLSIVEYSYKRFWT